MSDLIIYNTDDGKANVALLVMETKRGLHKISWQNFLTPLYQI